MTNEPLECHQCGAPGQVVSGPLPGHHVTAHKDGRVCCQSRHCPTEEEAIAAWVKAQEGRRGE